MPIVVITDIEPTLADMDQNNTRNNKSSPVLNGNDIDIAIFRQHRNDMYQNQISDFEASLIAMQIGTEDGTHCGRGLIAD